MNLLRISSRNQKGKVRFAPQDTGMAGRTPLIWVFAQAILTSAWAIRHFQVTPKEFFYMLTPIFIITDFLIYFFQTIDTDLRCY